MTDKKLGFLPPYVSWITIILALLTIITFFAISSPDGVRYATEMGMGGRDVGYSEGTQSMPPTSAGAPMMDSSMPSRYPYPNPDVPITDTREFLKTYYHASMSTRDVPTLTKRVETIVRGYDGRVDQQSSSSKYGYVSFAVPQSTFNMFRAELESLVGSRFLNVNISSQNLLSQKVSIEEQQKQADASVAKYKADRQRIVTVHTNAVQVLQTQIDAATTQLALLRIEPSTPEIQAQIQAVTDNVTSLKQRLASENASYTSQLASADRNITYAQNWQKAVQTQDQALLDNVATVTGTVSIQWISLWEIALLYLPGFWIPTIFAVLTVLSFYRDRRRVPYTAMGI